MVMEKSLKVCYFHPATGQARDISDLDPANEEAGEAGRGGLTEFSGRANAAVARAVANSTRFASVHCASFSAGGIE